MFPISPKVLELSLVADLGDLVVLDLTLGVGTVIQHFFPLLCYLCADEIQGAASTFSQPSSITFFVPATLSSSNSSSSGKSKTWFYLKQTVLICKNGLSYTTDNWFVQWKNWKLNSSPYFNSCTREAFKNNFRKVWAFPKLKL